jgi:hypothetical protein
VEKDLSWLFESMVTTTASTVDAVAAGSPCRRTLSDGQGKDALGSDTILRTVAPGREEARRPSREYLLQLPARPIPIPPYGRRSWSVARREAGTLGSYIPNYRSREADSTGRTSHNPSANHQRMEF